MDELSLQARSRFIIGCSLSVGVSSLGAGQRVTCSLPAVSGWHWLSRWLYRRVPRALPSFSFGRGEMLTIATMAIFSRLLPIPSAYSDHSSTPTFFLTRSVPGFTYPQLLPGTGSPAGSITTPRTPQPVLLL